ncbi:terpene synthase family protein [Lentzea roselyniae]|uniref:Terpene synthase n=1 Tax=Lentzea roselyniae TaxID=531940 RepID=A0ABP7CE19_9PSEU
MVHAGHNAQNRPDSECSDASRTVPATTRLAVVENEFTRHWHPYRWQLRETTLQWIVEQRLISDDVVNTYSEDLLCYTDLIAGYYVGDSSSVVQAIADFSAWFFLWDDRHSIDVRHRRDQQWWQLSAELRQSLRHPAQHRDHPEPLVAAFADSVGRIFGQLGQAWDERFAEHMDGIFVAYDREYRNLIVNQVPTVADYLQLRRWTFGHDVWIDLLELTAGCELPPSIQLDDTYQRAAHASQEFASSYNDLCSMPKEIAAGDIHNLGICFMHHEGLDEEQAQAAVRLHVIDCITRFGQAESEIPALWNAGRCTRKIRTAVESCVFNMRNWISSTYWFHHESSRYRPQDWDNPAWPPYLNTGGVS